jgi:hypothetical protein
MVTRALALNMASDDSKIEVYLQAAMQGLRAAEVHERALQASSRPPSPEEKPDDGYLLPVPDPTPRESEDGHNSALLPFRPPTPTLATPRPTVPPPAVPDARIAAGTRVSHPRAVGGHTSESRRGWSPVVHARTVVSLPGESIPPRQSPPVGGEPTATRSPKGGAPRAHVPRISPPSIPPTDAVPVETRPPRAKKEPPHVTVRVDSLRAERPRLSPVASPSRPLHTSALGGKAVAGKEGSPRFMAQPTISWMNKATSGVGDDVKQELDPAVHTVDEREARQFYERNLAWKARCEEKWRQQRETREREKLLETGQFEEAEDEGLRPRRGPQVKDNRSFYERSTAWEERRRERAEKRRLEQLMQEEAREDEECLFHPRSREHFRSEWGKQHAPAKPSSGADQATVPPRIPPPKVTVFIPEAKDDRLVLASERPHRSADRKPTASNGPRQRRSTESSSSRSKPTASRGPKQRRSTERSSSPSKPQGESTHGVLRGAPRPSVPAPRRLLVRPIAEAALAAPSDPRRDQPALAGEVAIPSGLVASRVRAIEQDGDW